MNRAEFEAKIALAILANEPEAMLHYNENSIPKVKYAKLPSPQKSGTERQNVGYATVSARFIADEYWHHSLTSIEYKP
jgi:hypothetical protein